MKKVIHGFAAVAIAAGAVVVAGAPAQAAACTSMSAGVSTYYDYAWLTDQNYDCGMMAVKHKYVAGGQLLQTSDWGTGYYIDTNREPELYKAYWSWKP